MGSCLSFCIFVVGLAFVVWLSVLPTCVYVCVLVGCWSLCGFCIGMGGSERDTSKSFISCSVGVCVGVGCVLCLNGMRRVGGVVFAVTSLIS